MIMGSLLMQEVSRQKERIRAMLEERQRNTVPKAVTGTQRVDLRLVGHTSFEAKTGAFNLVVDEPGDRGGTGLGPAPLNYFLLGAASCLMMQYARISIAEGVPLDSLEMTGRGHVDKRRGGSYFEMIYDIRIQSGESPERILMLARESEEFCYVHQTLNKSVRLITNVNLNGKLVGSLVTGPDT